MREMRQDKAKIIIKGEDKTHSIRSYSEHGDKVRVVFNSGKAYFYSSANVIIEDSTLSDGNASNCFEYLKGIARAVGLHDPQTGNILSNQYEKIEFVGKADNMLAAFLTGNLPDTDGEKKFSTIYPFGFNHSQKTAVDIVFANPLTIIEGPPGTGKTQTILNIIANAVMRGENIAVVSSNNSATANILEKLKKYDVDFIAAYLGNSENKQQFINSQKPLPNLFEWRLKPQQKRRITHAINKLFISLGEKLTKKNELSQFSQELDLLKVEYQHFCDSCEYDDNQVSQYLKPVSSNRSMELWLLCEKYTARNKKPYWIGRILNRMLRGVINDEFYTLSPEIMVTLCQKRYYMTKIFELTSITVKLRNELSRFDFERKMKEYSELSAQLFRNKLAERYKDAKRRKFDIGDLRKNSKQFIEEYPVILATTYSLKNSLSKNVVYNYVIVDEASQVDIATGALALSCARKAVIVGDLKQLPNVVDNLMAKKTDDIFAEFNPSEVYRYRNHSLLSAVSELFPDAPKTLLREHYRCHSKIIGFCNQKFYNNQLIVLTEGKTDDKPLVVYKTAPGNHARERVNQRQIDVIKDEIIPNLKDYKSIGIVSPYRNQTNALQKAFAGTGIQADTVDKFQGRENDVIILSTVDNEISEFTDNANRLNVAVSRAIERLIVVMNGGDEAKDTNVGDLIRYIQYNNFEIIESELYSVFDYLYKNYQEKRNNFLRSRWRISKYDSENLMYALIKDVLSDDNFIKLDVATHIPLRMIFRDLNTLDKNEKKYAENILTHVDFLIFDKCGKTPRLAIEVDGTAFHKDGSRQSERDKMKNVIFEKYGLPLIRFKTNESNERSRLVFKLNEI
ncbi:MAG: AAA domain-containing protein [Syntrophorhabdaceae bacterium]|nr:AAA domain-containing protein [Syntrophorhabdaceae bacterium]